jgi:hypothetical protein
MPAGRYKGMTTAQITLTEKESERLRTLAQNTGKTEEELLHEAVEIFLSGTQMQRRLELLRQARGIWKDRQDLPSLESLRASWDRHE